MAVVPSKHLVFSVVSAKTKTSHALHGGDTVALPNSCDTPKNGNPVAKLWDPLPTHGYAHATPYSGPSKGR